MYFQLEKVQVELSKRSRKEEALIEKTKRVQERLRNLKKSYNKLKDKDVDEKEIFNSPEMLFTNVRLCQLAAEIRLFKLVTIPQQFLKFLKLLF